MSLFSESLRAFLKPVVPLLDDPAVSEILINGPREVWIEKEGRLSRTEVTFTEEGLLAAARNMAQYVGRPLSEDRPRLDARLPDGSRIHVVLGPVARKGTTISIRKFFAERLSMEKLIELGSLDAGLVRLLRAAIELRLNIVVSGGTGSGKTSLLNALSSMIAPHERILTIEDSAELQLGQPHLVSLESRPADKQGKGEINIGDLLHSALRLRPDRIIVGEVRGGECFYLLQAMNTGHGGTLTTAHANTPIDTLRRLETLCLLSGVEMPLRAVRAQVASAVHLLVTIERLADGRRKITCVSEVLPLDEAGDYRVQDLYLFEPGERQPDGEVRGRQVPTGLLPGFFSKLRAQGIDLPASFFDPAAQGLAPPLIFSAGLGARSVWAKDHREKEMPRATPAASIDAATPAKGDAKPLEQIALEGLVDPSVAQFDTLANAAFVIASAAEEKTSESTDRELSPPLADRTDPSARAPTMETGPVSSVKPGPTVTSGKAHAPGAIRSTTVPTPPPAIATPPPSLKRSPAPSQAPSAPLNPNRPPAPPTIELDPELAREVAAAMPYESTLITRNPLLDRAPIPNVDDDNTNPGARRTRR